MSMERKLKWAAFFGAATAFWLGVISEAVATCLMSDVCSYPRTAAADAIVLVFWSYMTWRAVRVVREHRGDTP